MSKRGCSAQATAATASGRDLAEAALFAGIGRAAEGAGAAYRDAEAKARRQGKGLWARQ
jgi:endonuclease YncB( thermonuclease family)